MSEDNLKSKYYATTLQVSRNAFDSVFEKQDDGTYEEVTTKIYEGAQLEELYYNLSKSFFDFSLAYESDNIEPIAFSLYFMDKENSNAINSDTKFIALVLIASLIYMTIH